MKKTTLIISLTIFITVLLAYTGIKPFAAKTAAGLSANDDVDAAQLDDFLLNVSEQVMQAADPSCANPTPADKTVCQAMEQEILDSTVRIIMLSSLMVVEESCCRIFTGNGYATVKEGRYLVTHNHYNETVFSLLQQGDPDNALTINVINSNDELILQVPAQSVAVLVADGETSVLDFGETNGIGVFAALGIPSAGFVANPAASLQPGMEVAQIDWDGSSPHISWTTIEIVVTISGNPIVKLPSCIRDGASGGGLFWQGDHIGNNWSRSRDCDNESAPSTAHHSFAALNSTLVAAS